MKAIRHVRDLLIVTTKCTASAQAVFVSGLFRDSPRRDTIRERIRIIKERIHLVIKSL